MSDLRKAPVSLAEAKRYLADHHSHNSVPPAGWLFGTAVYNGPTLCGIGMAGRPARGLQDGATAEITRVCTVGDRNACSMIYGGLLAALKAIGWRRAYTYTLKSECAACVRAVGFVKDADLRARGPHIRPLQGRYVTDLFGTVRRPPDPKVRWLKVLAPPTPTED